MRFSVFVLNLKARTDRWLHVESELARLKLSANRVEAVDSPLNNEYLTKLKVAACWQSHKLAMENFLNSDADIALILEDDFKFVNKSPTEQIAKFESIDLDFLQVGFLYTSLREYLYIAIENLFDRIVRVYGFLERIIRNDNNSNKQLVNERRNLPLNIVLSDIRPGAHAYILNRKAASYLVSINEPIFLSTDDLFMAVGPMKQIRMGRLRRSAVAQIKSISSINPK